MTHRLRARAPETVAPPRLASDPDLVSSFLEDAAHVPGGHAAGVSFPRNEAEVAALVRAAARVLPVGAQSSLTGGATPRGDVVLSTRALTDVELLDASHVRAGAGVTLADLQRILGGRGLAYPPVPTYDGAFVGGVVATNAAGAATFKYGSTRQWVDALTLVLADGSVLDVRRGEAQAHPDGWIEIERADHTITRIVLPTYTMPRVAKLSAGYFAAPGMDAIDLFIGAEGTLAVVVAATLKVMPRGETAVALVRCPSDAVAIAVTGALCQDDRLDVAGIEYMDSRSLSCLDDAVFARAGVARPPRGWVYLLAQIEGGLERFGEILDTYGAGEDAAVATPGDTRGAARLFELREAVPAAVNARVAQAKASVDPAIQKTAGDMIVPFERLGDSLALYRDAFDRRGLDHATWGHFSDGNLHPNVIPRSRADVEAGRDALLEIGRAIAALGGAPLAEHGVGRSPIKQALLRQMYGDAGIAQMRAVKRALDPEWKLAAGNIFDK